MPKANLCPCCDEPLFNIGDELDAEINGVKLRTKCIEIADDYATVEILEGSLKGHKARLVPQAAPDTMRYVN
jgi:hypothetical protein